VKIVIFSLGLKIIAEKFMKKLRKKTHFHKRPNETKISEISMSSQNHLDKNFHSQFFSLTF